MATPRGIELRLCDRNFLTDQDGNQAGAIASYGQDYDCSYSGSFIAACRLGVRGTCLETIGSINVKSTTNDYSKLRLTADYKWPKWEKTEIHTLTANELELILVNQGIFLCDTIDVVSGIIISGGSSINTSSVNISTIEGLGCVLSKIKGEIGDLTCSSLGINYSYLSESNFILDLSPVTGTGEFAEELEPPETRSAFTDISTTFFAGCAILDNTPNGYMRFTSDLLNSSSYFNDTTIQAAALEIRAPVKENDLDEDPQIYAGGYGDNLNVQAKGFGIYNHSYPNGSITADSIFLQHIDGITSDLQMQAKSYNILTRNQYTADDMDENAVLSGQFIQVPIFAQELSLAGASIPWNYAIIQQPISTQVINLSNFVNDSVVTAKSGQILHGINNGIINAKNVFISGVTGTGIINNE